MSLLKLLVGGSGAYIPDPPPTGGGGGPDPGELDELASDPNATPPYTLSGLAPYNSPAKLSTPTYDGSGQAIHPKVLDFGTAKWRGWRYWMAHTPFPANDDLHEDPSILVSQNGYYWQLPPGCRDPLYNEPPRAQYPNGFNSDTHLMYDPVADQLIVLFRQTLDAAAHKIYIARSSDGVTWPVNPTALTLTYPSPDKQTISPAMVRVANNDWRLFGLDYAAKALSMWKAASPEGPWSGPYRTVGGGISGPTWNWHLEVEYIDGIFRTLVDRGPVHEGRPDGYRASSSRDGLSWNMQSTDFMTHGEPGTWDAGQLYRACMLGDGVGDKFRIWYSAHNEGPPNIWGIGYTEVPQSLWPAPPDALVNGSGTAYKTLALSHGSTLMWRLGTDPTASTTEADASGNGRVGAWEGRYVRSNTLTGESGYASRVDQAVLWRGYEAWMSSSDLTIRMVIKPEQVPTGSVEATLVALCGANGGWALKLTDAALKLVHYPSETEVAGPYLGITPNVVAHVAMTLTQAGAIKLYKNGVEVASGSVPAMPSFVGSRFSFGNRWNGTGWADFAKGSFEYLDVVPSILTEAQILASANEALS